MTTEPRFGGPFSATSGHRPSGENQTFRLALGPEDQKTPATLQVVDADGEVKADHGGDGGGRDPVSSWMRNIHGGGNTGLIWRTIIVPGGIAPVDLAVSGLIMWLRRRARRLAMTRRIAEA